MSAPSTAPSQFNGAPAQYAVKKRRRPQAKKESKGGEEIVKSNPSKRHRDRLNNELEELSQLIPFPSDLLNKLDKLSILRLVVSYLRNKSYHAVESYGNDLNQMVALNQENRVACLDESEGKLALSALHGFIMIVSQDFNIFHVTESVQDYLGFPQCDMMNLSVLDFVHVDDRETFMKQMSINPKQPSTDTNDEGQSGKVPEYAQMWTPEMFQGFSRDGLMHRSFICRLRCLPDTSSGFLALHFTGHLRLVSGQNRVDDEKKPLPPEVGLFLLASPLQSPSILEIRTKNFIFRTKHKLDYTPLGIDAKGKIVLGYTEQQLRQRSGYEFIHSADMMHCADAHTKLMRLGESGYTVFRLLHKDNRWVWVTASARLIYRSNGEPDYIIATQKPIQDQEGEEHMKKRSNAFRFDFTGQAILYGEVNPIGTRGGPENNPLPEEFDQPPVSKKQRFINQDELDRKSLYGAQAMQRMDIYMGNLPNQSADTFTRRSVQASAGTVQCLIENEMLSDSMGPLGDESAATFYPVGTNVPQGQKPIRQPFRNPNNYPVSANSFQRSFSNSEPNQQDRAPQNMVGVHSQNSSMAMQNPSMAMQNPSMPMQNPSMPMQNPSMTMQNPSMVMQEPARLSHPPTDGSTGAIGRAYAQEHRLKRPYPTGNAAPNTAVNRQAPRPGQLQRDANRMSIGEPVPNSNPPRLMHQEYIQPRQQPLTTASTNQMPQGHVVPPNEHQQLNSNNVYYKSADPLPQLDTAANQLYHDDQNIMGSNLQRLPGINDNQTSSVLQSMTIESVINLQQQQQEQQQQNMNANMQLPVPDEFDAPLLVGYQDNTIRFDLDQVAANYQTTDPLSMVQQYMHDNPKHAAAIATGMRPEAANSQPSDNQNFMSSCQYQTQQQQPQLQQPQLQQQQQQLQQQQLQQQQLQQQQLQQQQLQQQQYGHMPNITSSMTGYPNSVGTDSSSGVYSQTTYETSEEEIFANPNMSSPMSLLSGSGSDTVSPIVRYPQIPQKQIPQKQLPRYQQS